MTILEDWSATFSSWHARWSATRSSPTSLRGAVPDTQTGTETVYARALAHISGTPICPSMPLHALRLHRAKPFDIVHLQFPADPMAHIAAAALPPTVKRVITWHS